MTIALQALSLVEKAESVQVHFTLRLRDQRSIWIQDGCKVYMDSLHGIKWIMFHGHFDYFVKPPLGSRPNTKPGDHGTLNAHNRWFNLFYHMWGPTWIKIHWNSILVKGPVTYDFTVHLRVRDHTTWFWRCVGTSVFLVCLVNATFLMWWVCHKKVVQLYHYYSQNLRQLGKLLHYQAIKDSPNTSPSTKNSNESIVELSDRRYFWA